MVDVDEEYSGVVIEKLSARKAELTDMVPSGAGKTRLTFLAPSRALIGYQGEFLTDTRGSGVLNRVFSHYEPYKGAIEGRRNGVLVSNSDGDTSAFALWNLEDRGVMFVGAGEKTYQGMIVGENSRSDDLDVNPMKSKQLDQHPLGRQVDEAIRLTPPRRLDAGAGDRLHRGRRTGRGHAPSPSACAKKVLNPTFRKKRMREDALVGKAAATFPPLFSVIAGRQSRRRKHAEHCGCARRYPRPDLCSWVAGTKAGQDRS